MSRERKYSPFLLAAAIFVLAASPARASFFETRDGALIYYEDRGQGPTVLLVHGWTASSRFWRLNVPELAKEFRVVTLDLRGHGSSSKILEGHTVPQYARDVRALIERLRLEDVTLVGWSLGGPVVLSYWEQFAGDHRLRGIGLVDSNMAPFNQEPWNSHALKTTTMEGVSRVNAAYIADRTGYATVFAHNMFKGGRAADDDLEWVVKELLKTPPWIALAIYNDFVIRDYSAVLADITVPAVVWAADSNVFKTGIDQGKSIAGRIPKASFIPCEDAGHLLFYEQPAKFNKSLADFVRGLK